MVSHLLNNSAKGKDLRFGCSTSSESILVFFSRWNREKEQIKTLNQLDHCAHLMTVVCIAGVDRGVKATRKTLCYIYTDSL